MKAQRILTHDEKKASEAAFRGLPLDNSWTDSAKAVYEGLIQALEGTPLSKSTPLENESHETQMESTPLNPDISEPSQVALSPNSGEIPTEFESLPIRSRKEAIESGILKDVTPTAQSVGLDFCVGMTNPLWDQYITSSPDITEERIQTRLRDTLVAVRLRLASLKTPTALVDVPVLLQFHPEPTPQLCLTFALFHKDPVDGNCLLLIHPGEVFATRQAFENN
ncbi:MAG: hypothetical protein KC592_03485 [Nitrospira sp.]|nr:hypothetical protein [Nitrospira sp.]HBP88238.1 hypothetical protein [Nitrospiraceae bacterium]HNP29006.1 hypothetical protein [Nitrospirales bacterium]